MILLLGCCGCRWEANNHNATGVSLFQTGQVSQSISEFQKAIADDPQNADAYYNLGSCYYTLAKQSQNPQYTQQAEQLFRQSISLNDRHVPAHRALAGLLVETNRQQYAFDLLNAWQLRHPEMTDPLVESARLYEELGNLNKAGEYLADALRVNGNDPRTLKAIGGIRERQGNLTLALENYYRSYQADSRQTDLAVKINELQTRLASFPTTPPPGAAPPGATSQIR